MSEALIGKLATVKTKPRSANGIGKCVAYKDGKYKIQWKILGKSDWFNRNELYFP